MFKDLLKTSREEAQKIIAEITHKVIDEETVHEKIKIINDEMIYVHNIDIDIEKGKVDIDGDGKSHPKQYFEGLDEKTKQEREAAIENRQTEKGQYDPLPGDEDAKTKPSKHTRSSGAAKVREEMKGNGKNEFIRAASKVSGVSRSIIEEVYDKGLKAWSTSGHRPGATAQQWAIARVYAFLFDAKSGARKADIHLWERHLKAKKSFTIREELAITLKNAYDLRKKLLHKDKYSKHANKLLTDNKLYLRDFEYCFKNLESLNPLSLDYQLLGGGTMLELEKLIKSGLSLDQALNQKIEIKD